MKLQPAVVAGHFYPAKNSELTAMLKTSFGQSNTKDTSRFDTNSNIKAIIAPHAGYIYSGQVAATAYEIAQITQPKRVVVLGPSHRVAFKGIALSSADTFATPLGHLEVDKTALWMSLRPPWVDYNDHAFAQEHSVDVHLPFIKYCFPDAKILPAVVGDAPPHAVANLLTPFLQDNETLVVISSDLSHFHPYEQANTIDSRTSQKICALQNNIQPQEACGCRVINGLAVAAAEIKAKIHCVDLKNSGDTAGDKSRVVGYGAYVVTD